MGLYRLEDGSGLIGSLLAVQRQTVLHYAGAAARADQVRTPTVGMLTFLEDTKVFDWWNGTMWVGLAATRVPSTTRVALAGTTVTGAATVQATATVAAVNYPRALLATFYSYGHATGAASSTWYFRLHCTLGTGESLVGWMGRDPTTPTDQTVAVSMQTPLPANTAVTVTADVALSSTTGPSWVYTNLADLRRNHLDVTAV